MARSQARIQTTIWHDPDFVGLSAQAQRTYFLALSQEQVNFCGVVPYTARRWSRLAPNTTVKEITKAVNELASNRFVVIDEDTEELFIRSFAKNDGVLKSPNLVTAMGRDFLSIHSDRLREAFLEGLPEGFPEGLPKGIAEGLPDVLRRGSRVRSAEPLASVLLPSSSSSGGSSGSVPDVVLSEGAEEEEDQFTQEARRRLLLTTGDVVNPTAWVCKTAKQLRDEGWMPPARPVVAPPPRCSTCNDLPLAEPCGDCANGHDEARSA